MSKRGQHNMAMADQAESDREAEVLLLLLTIAAVRMKDSVSTASKSILTPSAKKLADGVRPRHISLNSALFLFVQIAMRRRTARGLATSQNVWCVEAWIIKARHVQSKQKLGSRRCCLYTCRQQGSYLLQTTTAICICMH